MSEDHIIGILQEQDAGMVKAEICHRHGISTATFYKWVSGFGGMDLSEAKRLRSLGNENARLKKLSAEVMLNNAILNDLAGKT